MTEKAIRTGLFRCDGVFAQPGPPSGPTFAARGCMVSSDPRICVDLLVEQAVNDSEPARAMNSYFMDRDFSLGRVTQ
ncbi:MAG: hypothetical protein H3C26_12330 [Rhodocyclaceae bacterium]|nr:hypothetical protein [Rhodocyclaceae bacterium]